MTTKVWTGFRKTEHACPKKKVIRFAWLQGIFCESLITQQSLRSLPLTDLAGLRFLYSPGGSLNLGRSIFIVIVIGRNRFCSASDSAYSYTFLSNV